MVSGGKKQSPNYKNKLILSKYFYNYESILGVGERLIFLTKIYDE